jgi:hypothetical protein
LPRQQSAGADTLSLRTLKSGLCQSSKQLHYASTTHASVVESHIHTNPQPGSLHSITGLVLLKFLLLLLYIFLSISSYDTTFSTLLHVFVLLLIDLSSSYFSLSFISTAYMRTRSSTSDRSLVINSLLLLAPTSEMGIKLGKPGLPQNQDDDYWQPASCSMYIVHGITNASTVLSSA